MPGLDYSLLKSFRRKLAHGRINRDVQTDLILAPHYSAIYAHVGEELWEMAMQELRAGTYEPELPITIDIPKKSGLTRPGSILSPLDRVVYQAIIDSIAQIAESQLSRSSVFSNVLLNPDLSFQMFEQSSISWNQFSSKVRLYCRNSKWAYVIKADISNFFERLHQHPLINLLHSAGCSPRAVNFLERLLLSWMEKKSYGILQGMFPSDFLGNFYLCGFDSYLADHSVPYARFVDDLYLFYPSLEAARMGLVDICRALRSEGLHLNERKTGIFSTGKLLQEETELDQLFENARDEVESSMGMTEIYGFISFWQPEGGEVTEEEIEMQAVETLYHYIEQSSQAQAEKIEKFCLPFLSAVGSDIAVERSLNGISNQPHLTQLYCSYLVTLIPSNPSIARRLEPLIRKDHFLHDWQLMWLVATLIEANPAPEAITKSVLKLLRDFGRSIALRALCAMFIGKHGTAAQRHNLHNFYSEEPSPYVRAAILFSARYFPSPERRTCLSSWKGHSKINSLIAEAVRAIV